MKTFLWTAWLLCLGAGVAPLLAGADTAARRVALVFDDGPEPVQAEKLHALLRQEGVRVTFAHVGRNVERHPDVSRAALAAGHEIVNHSYSHAKIAELDAAQVESQVKQGQEAIAKTIGVAPQWYWPPYLAVDQRLLDSIASAGLSLYVPHHLVDSRDWERALSAEEIFRRATTGVRDGSVILFHEWRAETVQQLPKILAELRRQGCVFFTFTGLRKELQEGRAPAEPPDERTRATFSAKPKS